MKICHNHMVNAVGRLTWHRTVFESSAVSQAEIYYLSSQRTIGIRMTLTHGCESEDKIDDELRIRLPSHKRPTSVGIRVLEST